MMPSQKVKQANYYQANKVKFGIKQAKRTRELLSAWVAILSHRYSLKCCHCGYSKNFAALDFHHLDPGTKDQDFSLSLQLKLLPTPDQIEFTIKELDKCIVLCSNCHRVEHSTCTENVL
jgi:hypothetical protein